MNGNKLTLEFLIVEYGGSLGSDNPPWKEVIASGKYPIVDL